MHAILVIHKTAFLHSNLNSSSAEILNLQLLSFFVLESLVYNNFTKDKSINAITCNSKERVLHMIITSTNPVCHSRHFNVIFRTELSFIRVKISAFQIWFQNNVFKIAENRADIGAFIQSCYNLFYRDWLVVRSYDRNSNLRWENESCLNICFLKFPSLMNLV